MTENTVLIILACFAGLASAASVALFIARRNTTARVAELEASLADLHADYGRAKDQYQASNAELDAQLQVAQMRLDEQVKHHQVLNQELVKSQERLQKDFEALSAKVFEENRKKFDSESKKALDSTLDPLKKEIEGFRRRIEDTHQEDLKDRSRLQGQILELQKQAQQIGQDAVQLATALKGESKSQGNWGEMVLERLLEDSGLENGREYETQSSHLDQEGAKKQPDVVIHLPDNKDIIVDSKVSLKAYEAFFNAETDEQREAELKSHLQSMRKHFTDLGRKSYESLEGLNSLDFVFMFMPIESAYTLALQSEPGLFQQAYDKNVIIVSPTTLMATLRTVSNIWRYEKQNRNTKQIAEQAGGLYDQFTLLVESLDEMGKRIDSVQKSYETARNRLSQGRGNLVRRVENLKTLGAKSKKQLPDSVKNLLED